MNNNDFEPFEVGTIFNKVPLRHKAHLISERKVSIAYPARLEAMALDPSKISYNKNHIYTAGQIDISVEVFKHISVKVLPNTADIIISQRTNRKSLVKHAALITTKLFGVNQGLEIDIVEDINLRHCGLGSSSGLIAGTITAINELFSKPLSPIELCRFSAQNHGEEIDNNPDKLIPVQCIGGSAVCGNYSGSLIIIAGEATPIIRVDLPNELKVVIGVPDDYKHPDSEKLMHDEKKNIAAFKKSGQKYGKEIAYRLTHQVLPSLINGNLEKCKDLIFDYRWDMGSIQNCSFAHPGINDIAEKLRVFQFDDDAKIISLSSVGPGFFVLTTNPAKFESVFKNLSMTTIVTSINNGTYRLE